MPVPTEEPTPLPTTAPTTFDMIALQFDLEMTAVNVDDIDRVFFSAAIAKFYNITPPAELMHFDVEVEATSPLVVRREGGGVCLCCSFENEK